MASHGKRGPKTEKLRKVALPGGAQTTVIGDLASHTHQLGKGKTKETRAKQGKGFTAPMVAPGNPRSGGPTTSATLGAKTKGGH